MAAVGCGYILIAIVGAVIKNMPPLSLALGGVRGWLHRRDPVVWHRQPLGEGFTVKSMLSGAGGAVAYEV